MSNIKDGAEDRQGKSAKRRAQILARAIELFAEQGPGASLRAIGDSIGVSHAALRYYFPSRDELLVEVYREHELRAHETSGTDVHHSAVETMRNSAEQNREIPGLVQLYATLTSDALQEDHHPVTRDFIRERFGNIRLQLAELIREGQNAGAIAADINADDAAALVAAASDGLQLQWLLDPDKVDISRSLALLERLLPPSLPGHTA